MVCLWPRSRVDEGELAFLASDVVLLCTLWLVVGSVVESIARVSLEGPNSMYICPAF